MSTEPTTELTGGMIEITENDLGIASQAFERMSTDPAFDKAIALAMSHEFDLVEATIQVRRAMMSMCLGKQLGIETALLGKFEEHPTWQTLVDTCIEAYDDAHATRDGAE